MLVKIELLSVAKPQDKQLLPEVVMDTEAGSNPALGQLLLHTFFFCRSFFVIEYNYIVGHAGCCM